MERDYRLDFLRAVAIIFVLIIHSANRYGVTHLEQLVANWFALFTRPTIAIFLFLAGYLLKFETFNQQQLSRRLVRVLIPYAVFSMLAVLYNSLARLDDPTQSPLYDHAGILFDFLFANTMSIYYFVFVIISMYVFAFLVLRISFLRERLFAITVILLTLNLLHALLYEPIVQYFQIPNDKPLFIYFYRSPLIWSAYFFLGILFRRHNGLALVERYKREIWIVFFAVFAVFNILYFTRFQGEFFGRTADLGYNSILGTVYSLATIAFLLTFDVRHRAIDFLSKTSYFMYLSHIFFVYVLWSVANRLDLGRGIWLVPLSLVISFVGPLILYFLARRALGKRTQFLLGA